MRTRTDMRDRVWRHLNDLGGSQYSTTNVNAALEDAAAMLWLDLLDPEVGAGAGRAVLRTVTAPRKLRAYQAEYALPSDCLGVERLEVRDVQSLYATLTCGTAGETVAGNWAALGDASVRVVCDRAVWDVTVDLAGAATMADVAALLQAGLRALTGGEETVTWSTDHFVVASYEAILPLAAVTPASGTDVSGASWMNGLEAAATVYVTPGCQTWERLTQVFGARGALVFRPRSGTEALWGSPANGCPQGWTAEGQNGYVRFDAAPSVSTQYLWRAWYYRKPVFPTEDGATFAWWVPEGADACCEFLAAALLGTEELENDRPIGTFGQMYQGHLRRLVNTLGAGLVRPSRRYIR